MLSILRRRMSFAGLVAIIALVFAMSGGAWAAKKYLITSTSQISPSVLKKLKGSAGPAGPAGQAGQAGIQGASGKEGPKGQPGNTGEAGPEGSPWTAGGTLPSGKTETGAWAMSANEAGNVSAISFEIPLQAGLPSENTHVIKESSPAEEKAKCDDGKGPPASPSNPEADPGQLCVFITFFEEGAFGIFDPGTVEEGAGKTGAALLAFAKVSSGFGTWAVTAP